jgi:hypothetical protein
MHTDRRPHAKRAVQVIPERRVERQQPVVEVNRPDKIVAAFY